jgi:hypothetical protein
MDGKDIQVANITSFIAKQTLALLPPQQTSQNSLREHRSRGMRSSEISKHLNFTNDTPREKIKCEEYMPRSFNPF